MSQTAPYRFDELGWLQFDRLCELLLGFDDVSWEPREFGRVGLALRSVLPPGGHVALAPPTLVVVAWLPRAGSTSSDLRLRRILETEVDGAPVRTVGSLLVLTNVDAPDDGAPGHVARIGPEQLGHLLDADPELRLRMPSVLGIRDLHGPIGERVSARSRFDVWAAAELARAFVPTRAYDRALEVVTRRHFAVLTGAPEMGKTAIARMIAFARMTAGWEAHECVRPEQLWRAFRRDERQVFVADDAFGSTEYRPEAAERWASSSVGCCGRWTSATG